MLFRPVHWIALLAATGVLVSGCATSHKTAASASESEPGAAIQENAANERDLIEAHAHYAAGVVHELDHEPDLALQEYTQAALKDPANEDLVLEVSRQLLRAQKPEKALEVLTQATRRPEASGALFARLGLIYTQLGKSDEAIKADRTAIRKSPREFSGYQNLFLHYIQAQQTDRALKVLDDAARVSDTDTEFCLGLAELYASFAIQAPAQRKAISARAIPVLQRAEKSADPDDVRLQLRLANAYLLLSQKDDAARIFESALKQLPDSPLLRAGIREKLAQIYLESGKRQQAGAQLREIVQENPTDARAYFLLGSIAFETTNYTDAADCFSRTILLSPDFEQAYYDLASVQLSTDKPDEALKTLEEARRKFPQTFLSEYLSGMACAHTGDYTNALTHFTTAEIMAKASNTNQLTEFFYFQFGAASERSGDYAQAEKMFQKCLELAPNFAEALNYLGYMWADRGEHLDRARELITRALKVEPKNAAYLDSMGWVLFKLNQPKQALDYELQAVQYSEEEDADLYSHLGDIYSALGDTAKASDAWRKSLSLKPSDVIQKKLDAANSEGH